MTIPAPSAKRQNGARVRRAAMMLLVMLLSTTTTTWAQDAISGLTYNTAGGYYEISDAQDLVDLANYVNGGNDTSGKTFKQTQDITLTAAIPQIGSSSKRFKGTYDGGDHSISGLVISADNTYVGLFCKVDAGIVKNLCLISPNITNTYVRNRPATTLIGVGSIAGYIQNGGTIQNCHVVSPTYSMPNVQNPEAGNILYGAIIANFDNLNYKVVDCYYYLDNYPCIGIGDDWIPHNCGHAYRMNLADGIGTSTEPKFTCGGISYYAGDITLTYGSGGTSPTGWFCTFAINGETIGNNEFTIEGDVTVTCDRRPDPDHFSQSGDTCIIHTAGGWNVFCDLLDEKPRGFFTNKTVKLDNDITISRMTSDANHEFTGTFDGQKHTLTLDFGTADAPFDAQFVAPFISTASGTTPTFLNLAIAGSIYATHTEATDHDHAGGLIGHLFGAVNIEHCTSSVRITAPAGAGGFVGLCEHNVTFTDCISSAVVTSPGGNNSGFIGWSRASGYYINFKGCTFNGKLLQQNNSGHSNGCFIGWTGSAKIVSIIDCLCTPASAASGEVLASSNSATFARGWNATTKATNSYYTQPFGSAQGEQAFSIIAGENVTASFAGTAVNTYPVGGITCYDKGISFDPEGDGTATLYAAKNDTVNLALGYTEPEGLIFNGYIVSPEGVTLIPNGNTYTLTMGNANVVINASMVGFLTYIDENGEQQSLNDQYTILTGGESTTLSAGWYVVYSDITYTGKVTLGDGNVNIILCNGKTMNVGTDTDNRVNGPGIYGSNSTLTIYAQTLDDNRAGHLNVYSKTYGNYTYGYGIAPGQFYIQNGGNVLVNTQGNNATGLSAPSGFTLNRGTLNVTSSDTGHAIWISKGDAHINGGKLDACSTGSNPGLCGIKCGKGTTFLCWTDSADYIHAMRFGGNVTIANGKYFIDENNTIHTHSNIGDIDGKTLRPFIKDPADVNCDRRVSSADLTALIQLLLNDDTNLEGDVNTDGRVTIADVTKLVNILEDDWDW